MRRRWKLSLAFALAAAAAGAWALRAVRRADRAVEEIAARAPADGEVALEVEPAVVLDGAAAAGLREITAVGGARDGAALGGRLFCATSGGLLAWAPGRAPRRPFTRRDGLAGVDLTAAAPLGERLVFGDGDGGLTVVDGERAIAARLRVPHAGAIADLAPAGPVVYALVTGVGVIAFDGRRAVDVARGDKALAEALRKAGALCVGDGGLAVGTSDGALYVERDAALTKLDAGLAPAPITALACDGSDLVVGTPFGVQRVTAGRARDLARDLFVTSLLPTPGALFVATFDDGVHVLDPESGRERGRHLAGERVHRLRLVDGRVMAFGPGGARQLTGGAFASLGTPPAGLSGPTVTALARDGAGALWVGTFEHGIDVLGPDFAPARHLPAADRETRSGVEQPALAGLPETDARDDQVNALLYRGDTSEVIAATVHGLDVFGPAGQRRLAVGEPTPDAISAVAVTAGDRFSNGRAGLALAGSRGLTFVDGSRQRTLYAFHGLANNHVYAVAAVGDRIYAGTLGGLSILDGQKVLRSIGVGPRALRSAWVTALQPSPEGIYVGTYGGGVQLLRTDGAVDDVSLPAGAFHVNPGALAVDGNTLFVGTLEAGLLAFDRTAHAWRRLPDEARLLPSRNVTALLADGEALLVGTASGLVRIPRTTLDEALAPIHRPLHPEGAS